MVARSSLEQLERRLLMASLLLLGACASPTPSDDEAGVTTNASSSSGASLDDSANEDSSSESTGDSTPGDPSTSSDTGDDLKFDIGSPPPLDDCTVTLSEPALLDEYPECPIVLDDERCGSELYWGCVPLRPGLTCADLCPGGDCIDDWGNCAGDEYIYMTPSEVCGPYEVDGQCCSLAEIPEGCGPGE